MEVMKGYQQTLRANVPNDLDNVITRIHRADGSTIGPLFNSPASNGVVTFALPFAAVREEGDYEVRYTFMDVGVKCEETLSFSVTAPYLDSWELEAILGEEYEGNIWDAEAAARHIVNAHTGQYFGKVHKTLYVAGDGTQALGLPERLISLDAVSVNGYKEYSKKNDNGVPYAGLHRFDVTGDGYILRRPEWLYYNTKADVGTRASAGPITAPRLSRQVYGRGMKYEVTGTFGYEEVPEKVRQAMKLLVNDYACSEIAYRDRYLESIKASDWRLQYNTGAYRRTGNARADHLLAPYVRSGMLII